MSILKVLVVVALFAGVGIGFVYLEKYVPKPDQAGRLELIDPPSWLNDELKAKIFNEACYDGEDLALDEDAAQTVQRNIEARVAWLDDVRVQTGHDSFHIYARWRKPLALVKSGLHKFYVDAELVVLDFVPMPELPIVKVEGLSVVTKRPPAGGVWRQEDLAAAVAVLERLDQRDNIDASKKPLLEEIDRVDVSNFNGRENSRFPHIILYAKDNTEIVWGAEIGKWQRHLEATDVQKIAKLYGYYEEQGSLLGSVKYINLRDPQNDVPLPVDKY